MSYPNRYDAGTSSDTRDVNRNMGFENIPSDLAKLSDLDNWEIADGEIDPRGWTLYGPGDENIGEIDDLLVSPSTERAYFALVDTGSWFNSRKFSVPLDAIRFDRDDQKAFTSFSREQFRKAPEYREGGDYAAYRSYWTGLGEFGRHETRPTARAVSGQPTTAGKADLTEGEVRVPVVEETVDVHKQSHEAGFITVRKTADVRTEHVRVPVTHTRVVAETRDIPDSEAYEYDANAISLREGQTLRIPIMDEEVVVGKKPRVVREVVLRAERETETVDRDVELRREHVVVDRQGDVDIEHMDEEEMEHHPERTTGRM